MRAPEFWRGRPSFFARVLAPLSLLWRAGAAIRRMKARPERAPLPVICVGGLVAGGSGKTPVAIALAQLLLREGIAAHIVSGGYRGGFAKSSAARRIDLSRHVVAEAGDEAMLLARYAPTWVCRDRIRAARAAQEAGAEAVILDDGFQDPAIVKDLSLLVVDGAYGFGNRRIIPAGPLRERIADGLGRADAVVLVGENTSGVTAIIPTAIPLLRANLMPGPEAADLAGREVVAFAGIGHPEKFFRTLEGLGCRIRSAHSFADHYRYRPSDIEKLLAEAGKTGAVLVTTAKDAVRLPEETRGKVSVLNVTLTFRDEEALARLLAPLFARG